MTGEALAIYTAIQGGVSIADASHSLGVPVDDSRFTAMVGGLIKVGALEYERPPSHPPTSLQQQFSVWLQMTDSCNLACDYCLVPRKPQSMSIDVAKNVVSKLCSDGKELGFTELGIKLSGGEPMLVSGVIYELVDWIKKEGEANGIKTSIAILSNGTHLPKNILGLLKEHRLRISLSMDGVHHWHDRHRRYRSTGLGSFPDVDKTVTVLLDNGVTPFILNTVTPENVEGLIPFVEYCFNRNIGYRLSIRRLAKSSNTLDAEDAVLTQGILDLYAWIGNHLPTRSLMRTNGLAGVNLLKKKRCMCGLGTSYFVINSRGGIGLCPHYDMHNELSHYTNGNIILNLRKQNRYTMSDAHSDVIPECRECTWRYTCSGSCPLERRAVYNTLHHRSPHCSVFQAILPEYIELHAKQLIQYSRRGERR